MPALFSIPQSLKQRTRFHWLAGFFALVCAAAGLLLGFNYPLGQPLMAGLFVVLILFFYHVPNGWLMLLPALLPLIGFAPWSGWLTFEELDLLVLAVATAGYTRWALIAPPDQCGKPDVMRALTWLLVALFGVSILVALLRGFSDAGGFVFGWFQGYHEPMNSLRIAKSWGGACLLLPLWRMAHQAQPQQTQNLLAQGLMLGLAAASLATVWERIAFTDFLNFSSDYRTTALFWEMHVGGATLDGFLALTVPFALREFLLAKKPGRWLMASAVLTLAAYACLTTFSRGVYLAIPIGTAVFLGLHARQQRQQRPTTRFHLFAAGWLTIGFAVGAIWVFETSGYRGMAALLGTVALMLALVHVLRDWRLRQWLLGLGLGVMLILLAVALDAFAPKGAYLAWGLAAFLSAVFLGLEHAKPAHFSLAGPLAFASFLATIVSTVLVANHWGDAPGWQHATPVLLAVLGVCLAAVMARQPLWPDAVRWQASTAGVMGLVAALVGVFGGGSYMTERFATGAHDYGGRLVHWQLGRDMLHSPADEWLGKGLGRFTAHYFLTGKPEEHPGDYRLKHAGANDYLTLTGGSLANGWGEMLRVTQRTVEPGRAAIVTARVRTDQAVSLHFEVCEKHLLYNQACVIKQTNLKSLPNVWQDLRVELQGDDVTRGAWYAPRLLAFSMAVASRDGLVDITHIALTRADGRQLLENGNFSDNMAHWFFSSDRYHLPWHIKNLLMTILFDQGLIGVSIFSLLLVGAVWRTSLGAARSHPLAPALAAGLLGFTVVGLFDSLLDVPRLGWIFYLLLLVALTLPSPAPRIPVSFPN